MRVTGYSSNYNPRRAVVATSGMEEVVKFWSAQPLPSPRLVTNIEKEAQGLEMEEELEREDTINLTAGNKADLRRLLDSQVDSETIPPESPPKCAKSKDESLPVTPLRRSRRLSGSLDLVTGAPTTPSR